MIPLTTLRMNKCFLILLKVDFFPNDFDFIQTLNKWYTNKLELKLSQFGLIEEIMRQSHKK